jgi:hypothetical protein
MLIPISSELKEIAEQYPLSYREVYALSVVIDDRKDLEKAIRQIVVFGMTTELYLIKMCHFSPMKVQELLYQPCTYGELPVGLEAAIDKIMSKGVNK